MDEDELSDQELEELEKRRECRYGGCRCCALLVEARDELEETRAIARECLHDPGPPEDWGRLFRRYPWLQRNYVKPE